VAHSGWHVRFDDVRLRPWSGYHLARLRAYPPGETLDPVLSAREFVVRPSWLLLLGHGPFPISFSGEAYGGTFSGSLDRAGGLRLEWAGMRIADYPRLTEFVEGNWSGDLSGELQAAGWEDDPKSLRGRGTIALKNAALLQGRVEGFVIPDLHFASGDCEFELKNGRVDVHSLKLSGSEVDADLRGQLFVATPQIVSATLTLKPIPGAPRGLEALLSLLNGSAKPRGGPYSFTVYGPVNALRLR
jgi:type II secretion system protein N